MNMKPPPGIVSLHKMIPNLLTLMALAAGLTAMQYAFDGVWDKAVLAIVFAAALDTIDGATARLLRATSEFGAQLDSLSDFLAFGVAPAVILYHWVLEDSGKIGWIAMLVFSAACALRLARFNVTQVAAKKFPWSKGFFAGVPAPAGAGLALLPIIFWVQYPYFFGELSFASPAIGVWVIFVAALMVSRIPTWSTKQIHLPARMAMPALAAAALLIATLIQAPWPTLSIMGITYIVCIPLAVDHFMRLRKDEKSSEDMTDLAIGAIALDSSSGDDTGRVRETD